jgi:beta-glucanase (GH16 family)
MRHKNDKGVVGTFIFFSPTGDEIDFEITAGKARQVQLNMFWQGQSLHGADGNSQIITMPQGFDTADWHAYTLDWNAQRIVYSIDGQAVKTIYRKDFKDDKGRFQYPATPMRAQVSVWDSSRMAKGTQKWTGGKPDYANADQYGTFTTQLKCELPPCAPSAAPLALCRCPRADPIIARSPALTIECNDPSSLSAGRNYGFSKKLDAKSGEPAVIGTDRASTV